MFTGTEPVVEAFKMSKKPHYKVYYNAVKAAGQMPCFESDPSADHGVNAERLADYFKLALQPGKYMIQFKNELNDNGGITEQFVIPGAPGSMAINGFQQSQQPAGIGYTTEHFNSLLDARLGAVQKDYELKLLQQERTKELAELIELRKADNALNNFLTNWAPMLVQVIATRFGVTPAGVQVGMAGFTTPVQAVKFTPAEQTQGTPVIVSDDDKAAETQLKLDEVLAWLTKEEGDAHKAVDLLYKMKQKAESNPALLGMLKTFLN